MYLCLVIRANPMVLSITLNLTLVVEGSDFLYIFFLELSSSSADGGEDH
jgi:hypothetical protein